MLCGKSLALGLQRVSAGQRLPAGALSWDDARAVWQLQHQRLQEGGGPASCRRF
jgi:hypothetical protein